MSVVCDFLAKLICMSLLNTPRDRLTGLSLVSLAKSLIFTVIHYLTRIGMVQRIECLVGKYSERARPELLTAAYCV